MMFTLFLFWVSRCWILLAVRQSQVFPPPPMQSWIAGRTGAARDSSPSCLSPAAHLAFTNNTSSCPHLSPREILHDANKDNSKPCRFYNHPPCSHGQATGGIKHVTKWGLANNVNSHAKFSTCFHRCIWVWRQQVCCIGHTVLCIAAGKRTGNTSSGFLCVCYQQSHCVYTFEHTCITCTHHIDGITNVRHRWPRQF